MKGTYKIYVNGYDWGAAVSKVIITLDEAIDAVSKDDFKIRELRQVTDFTKKDLPIVSRRFDRKIRSAYLSDENGNYGDLPSLYITLKLEVGPDIGNPMLFSMNTMYNTWSHPYQLTIDNEELDLFIDKEYEEMLTVADNFKLDSYEAKDGTNYGYVYYTPETPSDNLIVWLHGLGEGGVNVTGPTDPYIGILANKVTALAGNKFQNIVGPCHVLAPQCPTYWMDHEGDCSNFNHGTITDYATSYYTESLHELISYYKERIGAKKIIIAGCSNGGYMTMVLAIKYGHEYDGYVPICEALSSKNISDDEILSLKDIPLYFVYSKDDPVVPPADYEIPTIERLQKVDPTNLHVSVTDHVIDTSGLYKDKDGNPYQYLGHWSWIYFDNDETKDENGLSAFNWIRTLL